MKMLISEKFTLEKKRNTGTQKSFSESLKVNGKHAFYIVLIMKFLAFQFRMNELRKGIE